MKFSIFTVATPQLNPDELAAAAKEAGIDAIEWRYKEPPANAAELAPSFWGNNKSTIRPSGGEAELERFKQAADKHGLKSLSVTPYLKTGDLEGTEQVLRAASYLGAPFIRVGVPAYDRSQPFNELFEQSRSYLKAVESLCKSYGIKGLAEIHHGTIASSASGARRLCEGLDPAWVGVILDPGNMVFEGFENYRLGMEILGPYLTHVHVKNAGWRLESTSADGIANWTCEWKGLKDGMVPWKQVLEDLQAVGYDGYIGVEDFSGQIDDPREVLKHFTRYMRSLLGTPVADV